MTTWLRKGACSHSSIRRFGLAEPLGKHFRIKKKKPPSVCGNLELRGLRRALAVVVAVSTGIFNRTDSYLCCTIFFFDLKNCFFHLLSISTCWFGLEWDFFFGERRCLTEKQKKQSTAKRTTDASRPSIHPHLGGFRGLVLKCKQGSTMGKKKLQIERHKNQVITSNYLDHPTFTSPCGWIFILFF